MKQEEIEEKLKKQEEEIEKLNKKSKRQKWLNLFLIWKD
jgi:hypothetical protein